MVATAEAQALGAGSWLAPAVTGRPAGWCDMIVVPAIDGVPENAALGGVDQIVCGIPGRRLRQGDGGAGGRLLQRFQPKVANISSVAGLIRDRFGRRDRTVPVTRAEALARMRERPRKVSIHVNGWFGAWDKASGLHRFYVITLTSGRTVLPTSATRQRWPLFEIAALSVGVANIRDFTDLPEAPAFVTPSAQGAGFAEFVTRLMEEQSLP